MNQVNFVLKAPFHGHQGFLFISALGCAGFVLFSLLPFKKVCSSSTRVLGLALWQYRGLVYGANAAEVAL